VLIRVYPLEWELHIGDDDLGWELYIRDLVLGVSRVVRELPVVVLVWDRDLVDVYGRVCALRGVAGCDALLDVSDVILRETGVCFARVSMCGLRKACGCVFVCFCASLGLSRAFCAM